MAKLEVVGKSSPRQPPNRSLCGRKSSLSRFPGGQPRVDSTNTSERVCRTGRLIASLKMIAPSAFPRCCCPKQTLSRISRACRARASDWKLDAILPTFADRASSFISRNAQQKQPFLLYLPLTAPHTPIAVAKDWQGKSSIGHPYADFVMQTDDTVGRVLQTLQSAGVADNTLVIFTSDNGCASYIGAKELEAIGHYPSGPLRGYKSSVWEGGHRVPFVVRWPGQVKPNSTCDQTICSVDVLATLADLWESKLPPSAGEDSMSLLPLLKGESRPIHDAVIHHSAQGIFAVRSGKWKLILGPGEGTNQPMQTQLYDLTADLGEQKNLAAEQPAEVARLSAILDKWIADGRSTAGVKQSNDVPIRIRKIATKGAKR